MLHLHMGEDEDHIVDIGSAWHHWAAVKKLHFNLYWIISRSLETSSSQAVTC